MKKKNLSHLAAILLLFIASASANWYLQSRLVTGVTSHNTPSRWSGATADSVAVQRTNYYPLDVELLKRLLQPQLPLLRQTTGAASSSLE